MATPKIVFQPLSLNVRDRNKKPVAVTKVTGPDDFSALIYQCPLNVDWDGAPRAYGINQTDAAKFPLQQKLTPFETGLANARAGDGKTWSGVYSRTRAEALNILATDPSFGATKADRLKLIDQFLDTRQKTGDGRFPVVQIQADAPARGYYVSQVNATADGSKKFWDQRRYVDASTVPFGALSDGLALVVSLYDFALIIRNKTGESMGFFFGDRAGTGSDKVGECSGCVKTTLAPEKGGEDDVFSFIVFPHSARGTVQDNSVITSVVNAKISGLAFATADALARRLAPRDPELFNVRRALFEWGAPSEATPREFFPRDHGAEDATGEYQESPRTLTGY